MKTRSQLFTALATLIAFAPCFQALAGPPFPEFLDPNPNPGNQFGAAIVALSTGNVVITSPYDDAGGTDAGAVYVFNGATGALVSTLTGSSSGDRIGSGGVIALTNGNFVVSSQSWGSAAGAATFGNGVTGVSGVVSAMNSLVGSTSGDSVGNSVSLNNGNYVVISPNWDNGTVTDAGAVTFGNGTTGITGGVSPANSLVGSTSGDQVGGRGVTVLSNGNYVVCNSSWDNGAISEAGAATFGSGITGVSGPVSAANSLVGSQSGDYVGYNGAVGLSNGNYVVVSSYWHNGGLNYAGAVTFGIGTVGVSGPVSVANSLVGSSANDTIGSSGVTGLTNGNYVVCSEMWASGGNSLVGAATFGNGTTGVTGPVTAANSLVGTSADNRVGQRRAIALTNGNYVVSSPGWDNGAIIDVGAATFGNGTVGVSGSVSAANSLIGSTGNDQIGIDGSITPLNNGNYVVCSYYWDNGAIANVGAVTWCSGTAGRTGTVSLANSLVGSVANDLVGRGGVTPLSNGNYVVSSYLWDNGAVANAGAVTWENGTAGTTGSVSAVNSLVGSKASDWIGSGGVTALTNGNYVVTSPQWDNGGAIDAGAVTFGNGTTGLSGAVSAANSLVGSTSGDAIGDNSGHGVTVLSNGNYVVMSQYWNNGALTDAGAFTFGSGTSGVSGVINTSNSVIGQASSSILFYATAVMVDNVNQTFFARFLSETSGKVRLGSQTDGFAVYPEISVFTGNSTAAVDERTDNVGTQSLGSINVATGSVAQVFTIQNVGEGDLTGIMVTSTNGGEFSVNTTGTSATLAANATTTFTVTFNPSALGARSGVINIASSDANENPFRINVAGTGLTSHNADLSNLVISSGTLTPVFASGTMTYTASVPYTTANLTVTPTVAQANASITVNDAPVISGSASGSITLNRGDNVITIGVTAQDNTTIKTYTVTVTRNNPPPGVLDPTFGTGGKVTTAMGSGADEGSGVALQPDGKILLVGRVHNGSNYDFGLARYNANGTLDPSFGGGTGKVTTPVGSGDDRGTDVALQSDGKMVVAGTVFTGSHFDFGLVRYDANGSLDSTFGSGGKTTVSVSNADNRADAMAVQSDGKIVLMGFATIGATANIALTRHNTDGSLDTSFGTGGKVVTLIGTAAWGSDVAIQSDGKIVVTGYSSNGADTDVVVTRYDTTGTLDASFGSGGSFRLDFGGSADVGQSVVVQDDGKIVVAASTTINGTNDFAVLRCTSAGALDAGFGTGGKVITPIGSDLDVPNGVALQRNGKIVVAGITLNSNDDVAVVRYNTDGTLDTTFGGTGKVVTPIGLSDDFAYGVAVQSDGNIVVGGRAVVGAGYDFAVLRYFGDPAPPTVTAAFPNSGSTLGGTSVTLTGTGFAPGATVTIGGTAATGVIVVNTTTLTCTTPAGAPGPASVLVTTAGGTNLANSLYTFALPFSNNANLSALTTSAGALTPVFASGTFSYTAPGVWNTTTSISVTPTAADATAALQLRANGGGFVPAMSGSASSVALTVGGNAIDVKVTAQDGTTVQTYTVTVTRNAPGQGPPVTVLTSTVDSPTGVPGAGFDSIRSGMTIASSGALAFRGHLALGGGGVTVDDFQGIWKSPDGTAANISLVARSGCDAPDSGAALFDILPVNPIINNAGQTTFLGYLRVNTGSPLITTGTDGGVWSEIGGTGLHELLCEGDPAGGGTLTTAVPSTWLAGGDNYVVFTVRIDALSALMRVGVSGGAEIQEVLARESAAAPAIGGGTSGTFDTMIGNSTDPRMDAAGDVAFLGHLQAGGTGIWYQSVAGPLSAVAVAGEATPGGLTDTFIAFERPTLASNTAIAFRAFLATNGQSVFRGIPSNPASLIPVAVTGDTSAQIATIPAGSKLWSIWSPFSNVIGHLAFRVTLLDAGGVETRAVVTDTGGTLAVIAKAGDAAPGLVAETFANFDHPIIGDGDQVAFVASTDGGKVGLWRQGAGGGGLNLVLKAGDVMTVNSVAETVARITIPGGTTDDRKYETMTMDAAGHILVHVLYESGKTGILLTAP